MKIMHLADLHIGKLVNGFNMIEDQQYILNEIVNIAEKQAVEVMLLAGDIYDKSVPSAQAVQLFDSFITKISELGIKILAISGNHDSGERLSFGSDIMSAKGVHFYGVFDGNMKKVTVEDRFGKVNFYMLPFVKPAHVRPFYNDEIKSFDDAVKLIIKNTDVDKNERNVLLSHQFVTGAVACESEEIYIGGLENVDVSAFEAFDYVALGHMHGPQKVGRECVRYAGTPLKYSFSEVNHKKSVTIVDLGIKGMSESAECCNFELIPLTPKRDMSEIKGKYMDITAKAFYEDAEHFHKDDYMHITLTDEEDVPEAMGKLRSIYPNLMKLDYNNKRTSAESFDFESTENEEKLPVELFEELYVKQNNQCLSDEQKEYLMETIERIWEVQR